jgi:hypothetical protein
MIITIDPASLVIGLVVGVLGSFIYMIIREIY